MKNKKKEKKLTQLESSNQELCNHKYEFKGKCGGGPGWDEMLYTCKYCGKTNVETEDWDEDKMEILYR